MNTLDYIFIVVIVLFSVGALVNLWHLANRHRNESIQNYLDGKEKRLRQFKKD